jgi:mono/diheme cytochrome c family protein
MNRIIAGLLLVAAFARPASTADRPDPAALKFFEQRVRPVLANRCFECHGPQKQKNGLRLDSLAALLKGGDSGPALKPGKPDESLLLHVLRDGKPVQMPPKSRLPNQEIADLAAWIKMGAPWPDSDTSVRPGSSKTGPLFTPMDRDHWAFRALADPKPPAVRDGGWVQSPIDNFILA